MAIAFDAATDGGNNGGTTNSLTFAHTCTGSDRLLLVGFKGDVLAGNDDITSVTYGGVAMTLIDKISTGVDRYSYLYYLLNPASGSNNVVINCTNNHYLIPCAASYTGVAQSGQPDASSKNTGTTAVTGTVTTVADNCWLMAVGVQNFSGAQMTPGSGTTERVEESAFLTVGMYDSNAAITPAGSASLVVNGGTCGIIIASFAPAGAGSSVSASAAVTIGGVTASASATHTAPSFTASAAPTVGGIQASATAAHTTPTFEATAAATIGGATAAASASFAASIHQATAAPTIGGATAAASASFTAPSFTATAAPTVGVATATVSASHTAPSFTATAAPSVGGAEVAISSTFATSLHTATVAAEIGGVTVAVSATFEADPFEVYEDSRSVGRAFDSRQTAARIFDSRAPAR